MPTTVRSVCQAMEAWAPSSLAYDWDSVGLQIGQQDAPVSKIMTCLTVTEDVVKKAEKWGAEMIVAHHPILFRPLKALRTDDIHTQLCLRLVRGNVACFAAHTNLDVVPGGVNTLLAETLGLEDVRPLQPTPKARRVKLVVFVPETHQAAVRQAMADAGAGHIGDYSECSFSTPGTGTFRPGAGADPYSGTRGRLSHEAELRMEMIVPETRLQAVVTALRDAHPYEEPAFDVFALEGADPDYGLGARGVLGKPLSLGDFAEFVRDALRLKHVRVVGKPGKRVSRVAVCGGAGGGEVFSMAPDIDVYVTGDIKYHEADVAQARGLGLIDAGHVGTERNIATHIARYLRKSLKEVAVKPVVEPEIFQVVTASSKG